LRGEESTGSSVTGREPVAGAESPATPAPRLVLGLGNPGERYAATRHNIGFLVVERLARRLGTSFGSETCGSRLAVGQPSRGPVFLAQPQGFMNRSGYAARCFVEAHQLPLANVLVVYDDLHLPLGRLRLRAGGSPGGHRGLESVIEQLTSDRVPRLRLGIGAGSADGRPLQGEALVEFVLGTFEARELPVVELMLERAVEACLRWLTGPIEAAMSAVNGAADASSPVGEEAAREASGEVSGQLPFGGRPEAV
jgi:PTH1 family peptidyl-tRNA hydrolase